jgi:hypothetical protein
VGCRSGGSRGELLIYLDGVRIFAALYEADANEVLDGRKRGGGEGCGGIKGIRQEKRMFVRCEWEREQLSKGTRPDIGCEKMGRRKLGIKSLKDGLTF